MTLIAEKRTAQLLELKNTLLQELADSKCKSLRRYNDLDFYSKSELELIFEELADNYLVEDNEFYMHSSDEAFIDYELWQIRIDFADEALNMISDQEAAEPTEFIELFNDADKNSSSDEDTYISFVLNCRDALDIDDESSINVWHIKQNNLKTYENGRESIKSLCMTQYLQLKNIY